MKPAVAVCCACVCAYAQTTTVQVGTGAPNAQIQQSFIRVFFRNNFNNLVALPPLGAVKALGSQGLVQEFADLKNSASKYALIKPNINQTTLAGDADMVQMYPAIYAYYTGTGLGPTVAGYPTGDTQQCPALQSQPTASCLYQFFDKPYALFAYTAAIASGVTNIAVSDPIYSKWIALNGVYGAGPPLTAAAAATSALSGVTANVQSFDRAYLFQITSGAQSGNVLAVAPDIYPAYFTAGGPTGTLGFPKSNETTLANGHTQQVFEGGTIDFDPAANAGTLRFPIVTLSVLPSGPTLKLAQGDTLALTAAALDANGNALTGRTLVWSTSNNRVVAIQPNGYAAMLQAVGGGVATVAVNGEGKSSAAITVVVTAPCCAVGEGAPSPDVQQAFAGAVTRDRLALALPASGPVQRLGPGYVQAVSDTSGNALWIALPDGGSAAWVVSGPILTRYLASGGFTGPLGYPASDATAGGRQMFARGALAGSPVVAVTGPVLTKWAALGYETGAAGAPVAEQSAVLSSRGAAGVMQPFTKGAIAGPANGPVYFLPPAVAAGWMQAGGAGGALGLPASDAYAASGRTRVDFEGGYADFAAGDAAAQVHAAPRAPVVTASPATAIAGTRLRLSLGGFAPGDALRVSQTGQADFSVTPDSGAYAWTIAIPANAKAATVQVQATDPKTGESAAATYTVVTPSQATLQVSKASGDGQTAPPGAQLPLPLDVLVRDTAGNAVAGLPVAFSASSGAQIVAASSATDGGGHATATVRLAAAEGVTLISATAGKYVVTFGAQAAHSALAKYPLLTSGAAPALTAAAASILRFYQNAGALPAGSGPVDAAGLDKWAATCAAVCDGYVQGTAGPVLNLWRLSAFAGANVAVTVIPSTLNAVRDRLAAGTPVLAETASGAYVAATGVNADGSIAVYDPAGARTVLDSVQAAITLTPAPSGTQGFLVTGGAGLMVASPLGSCPEVSLSGAGFAACDGTGGAYEATGSAQLTVSGLAVPAASVTASSPAAIDRSGTSWTASPATLSINADGVVNAASFTPDLAPRMIATVFGTGLAAATAQFDGSDIPVIAAAPFQLSVVFPDTAAGAHTLTLTSDRGTATQTVTLAATAPASFGILNQDGTLNTPDNPAKRGTTVSLYGTGFGAFQPAVTVMLNGTAIRPAYAGPAPGFAGLGQVNIAIPGASAPGVEIPLVLQQGQTSSPMYRIAVQ